MVNIEKLHDDTGKIICYILLIILLFLLFGCSDDYNSCLSDCKHLTHEMFLFKQKVDRCDSWNTVELCESWNNFNESVIERYYYVDNLNKTAQRFYCFEKCKLNQNYTILRG